MAPARNERLYGALVALAVAALTVYAFLTRMRFLTSSPYPVGVDGYYYAIQLRQLVATGHLYYPSSPLVFWLLAPLSWLTDPIYGAKLGAAAGTALAVVPAYLLGKRLAGERAPALLAAALTAASAESAFLSAEFVKQGVGLTLAMFFLVALAALFETRTRVRVAAALILLAATFLAHKSSFGLALAIGAPALIVHLGRVRGLRTAALTGAGLLAAGLVFVLLGAHDLALLAHTFSATPSWSFAVLDMGDVPLRLSGEVLRTALLGIAVIATTPFARKPLPPLAFGLCALGIGLALPWLNVLDEQGLAMRLRLLAFVAQGPLAALLLVRALPFLSRTTRAFVAIGAMVGFLLVLPARPGEGTILAHPALVSSVRALEDALPEDAIVITPERHVAFMVVWYARVAVRLTPPAAPDPDRVFRLIPGALIDGALADALTDLRAHPRPPLAAPRDLHSYDPNGMVLLSERTFQALVASLPPSAAARWRAWPTQ